MVKNKKQLTILVLVIIVAICGTAFYFWDKTNTTFLDAKKLGLNCKIERSCGDFIGIDCNSATDGPYYYLYKKTGRIVSKCGGYCMYNCTNCPPKEWTCDTY